MPERLARQLRHFWAVLDGEGAALLTLFQWVIGAWIVAVGVEDLFIAHSAPLTLQPSMSWLSFRLWCWCAILAPIQLLIGKALMRSAPPLGARLQLWGDLTLFLVLLAYVTATFQVEPVGKGGMGGYLGAAIWTINGLMLIRDVRRLREVHS